MIDLTNINKIQITQADLANFAGSEIITLELTEWFIEMGKKVYVLTNNYDNPIKKEFDKLDNVEITDNPKEIPFKEIDLFWLQHNLIPPEILDLKLSDNLNAIVAFNHMSSFVPVESMFYPNIELYLADYIFVNSEETKLSVLKSLNINNLRINITYNPAPNVFNVTKSSNSKKLKNILIVSNHIPDEIRLAAKRLGNNYNVTFYGLEKAGRAKRIVPEDIEKADILITIGKTTQYSILRGKPVYCYDHFGGPGYLNENNYKKAKKLNFSGRGFTKKKPDQIFDEITSGYEKAVLFAQKIKIAESNNFTLDDFFSKNWLKNNYHTKPTVAEIDSFKKSAGHITDLHKGLKYFEKQQKEYMFMYQNLYKQSKRTDKELNSIIQSYNNIINSASWRLTKPLRSTNYFLSKKILKR